MEALAVEAETGSLMENRRRAAERLVAVADRAYRLAFRISGSSAAAEDAVQQAYLGVLGEMPAGLRPDEERLWFMEVVANAAAKGLRGEERRRRRETRAMKDQEGTRSGTGPEPEAKIELIEVLGRALQDLEAKYRLPVSLCCEQGCSKREAASILRMPESTVSKYVSIGLERLQKALAVAGYTVAPAAVLGGLAKTAPAVPAGLAAAVADLVAGGKALLGRAALGAAVRASARLGAKKAVGLALGWKAAAVVGVAAVGAVATPLVYDAFSRKSRAAVQPADDFDLAAAAARCKTVADLRALQPRIRAASEKMLADPDFDPDRVIGLEFADVAASRAQGDWEVPAATVAIRLALAAPQKAPPTETALGWKRQWNAHFAEACRLRHQGRHDQAARVVALPLVGVEIGQIDGAASAGTVAQFERVRTLARWLVSIDDTAPGSASDRSGVFISDVTALAGIAQIQVCDSRPGPAGRLAALWMLAHAAECAPEDDRSRQRQAKVLSWLTGKFPPAAHPPRVLGSIFDNCDLEVSESLVAEGESAAKTITDRLASILERSRR